MKVLSALYKTAIAVCLAALVGAAAWFASQYLLKDWELRRLKEVVARLEADRRAADVTDVRREVDPAAKTEWTAFRFVEYGPEGNALPAKEFRVQGTVVYFDALVIKFDREHVKAGDALRGKSLFLFRRIFGEHQKPVDGFPVDGSDAPGGVPVPAAYRLSPGRVGDFERELWGDFWRLAGDEAYQKAMGVRVAHGEAAYTRLEPGKTYHLRIESAGGISLGVKDEPRKTGAQ
jgi:hypothetical protein